MDMEEKGTQVCDQTGDTAPDAGEQEDFEALIRGRYKEAFDARVRKILDGRLRGMRQENQHLKEQQEKTDRERRAEAAGRIERLRRQEGELQKVYPDFCWQEEMRRELYTVVDQGGTVVDVAVENSLYGEIRATLNLCNRYDVDNFIRQAADAPESLLSRMTGGVHLHTLRCPDKDTFARIRTALEQQGLLYRKE